MQGNLQVSSDFEHPTDSDDSKYLCELSTILVATIQEVKDRVSQIEFIFCSQLYPSFQSRSKILQRSLVDARKAAEDEWKIKETSLLHQIEEITMEKQHDQERIHELKCSVEESRARLMNTEQLLNKHEVEKKVLLDKLESMDKNEEIIVELKRQLEQMTSEIAEEKELQQRLLQQIELKDQKLLVEQGKRRVLIEDYSKLKESYKHLKSQYCFLVGKIGDTTDKKHHPGRMEDEKASPRPHLNKRSLQDLEENDKEVTQLASKPTERTTDIVVHEKSEANQDLGLVKSSNTDFRIGISSNSSVLQSKSIAVTTKPRSLSVMRQASPCWRNTRARQGSGDADPHDDFLDTPMEVVKNLNRGPLEEAQGLSVLPPQDMDFNNSDDETQDTNAEAAPPPQQQHISILDSANKGFKYVEPVRKKAERENLKGVECKQCKKFYDAILPDGSRGKGSGMDTTSMHCEHHDGVSRHRYRYAPPMTPEGFWNIGFDSDV
ncbi:protein gamma response 1 [Elaeis guineensis]|uniref:Protein gamma response 1 n=1 Tax=Elaeis guineensis var. tenera TaxID=51953 RepID=A0A6I9QRK0_ELAGV|nr:protein gamma response 1 [Elaeis guineensis]